MPYGFEGPMAALAMAAYDQFLQEFRAGRRVFGQSRLPMVVVVDDGRHVCTGSCGVLPIGYTLNKPNESGKIAQSFTLGGATHECRQGLFVCPATLKAHVCGEGTCSGAYVVGPHGRTCVLTGHLVGADGSNLSHGWREDPGRTNWEGVSMRVFGECFRPGDEGHTTQRGRKRCRSHRAPVARAWSVAPDALEACAGRVRELFPGSATRVRLDEVRKCVAAAKVAVAIERYLRVTRNANQAVYAQKIDAISYRLFDESDRPTVPLLDDVDAQLLALGYCAIAAKFLGEILDAPANLSASPLVALVAFLYLQRQGVQAKACVLVDRDALLDLLLPAANRIDKFGITKGAFTAAKNRIQQALRASTLRQGQAPRTGGHTVAQVLREGAAMGLIIDQAAGVGDDTRTVEQRLPRLETK